MLRNFRKRIMLSGACVFLLGMMTPLTSFAHPASSSLPRVDIVDEALLTGGGTLNLVSTYKCLGGVGGSITVTVTQNPLQSGKPESGIATGKETEGPLNCDGHLHQIEVPVEADEPFDFNLGTATATATLTDPKGNKTSDMDTIKIVGS